MDEKAQRDDEREVQALARKKLILQRRTLKESDIDKKDQLEAEASEHALRPEEGDEWQQAEEGAKP
ncbi:hypothetical protein H0H92_011487 [Tricholoma furcatifolium]|nr:hypothetical protein H0H92_011487 [Tricholoma furcatifolium]